MSICFDLYTSETNNINTTKTNLLFQALFLFLYIYTFFGFPRYFFSLLYIYIQIYIRENSQENYKCLYSIYISLFFFFFFFFTIIIPPCTFYIMYKLARLNNSNQMTRTYIYIYISVFITIHISTRIINTIKNYCIDR
ncbi:hypothetical protein F4703DRAFT_1417054 [Phycomyces blakesleeanus]